jgi:hypothetical protein
MIIQYDSDGAFRRILRIEVEQQANEFDTAGRSSTRAVT